MNSQKFNLKRYALAIFMSISLLISSFLSMDARAASFIELANKTPALSNLPELKRKQKWRDYTLQEKQAMWTKAKLVPKLNQAILDVGNGFDQKLLSDSSTNVRHKAREKNAEITLYIAGIEQQDFYTKVNGYIKQNKIPTAEEAAKNLGIDYDPNKMDKKVEKNQQVRRAEKDKEVIIKKYVNSIEMELAEKKYIDSGRVPELEELKKNLNIDDKKAQYHRGIIRDQVMANKKAEFIAIGKIPAQEELNRLFGKDRAADDSKYINNIRTNVMENKKQDYIKDNSSPEVKDIMEKFNIDKGHAELYIQEILKTKPLADNNNNIYTSNIVNPGEKKQELAYTFDVRKSLTTSLKKKSKTQELAKNEQELQQQLELENSKEEFGEVLTKNPIEALIFAEQKNLDNSSKQKAVTAVLSKLNDQTIPKILFDKNILNQILTNCSDEQKSELIEKSTYYAVQTLPLSISNKNVTDEKKLVLATLTAAEKKLVLATLTAAENKPVLQEFLQNLLNGAGYKRKAELDKMLNLLLLGEKEVEEERNKIFKSAINKPNSPPLMNEIPTPPLMNRAPPIPPMNGIPPAPPFGHNNNNTNNLDLNKLNALYPELYVSYSTFIANNTKTNISQQKFNAIATSIPQERSEPKGPYAQQYMTYRTETNKKEATKLQNQKIMKKADLIAVVRQIITKSYTDADFKTLVALFRTENEQIKKDARKVWQDLAKDPYIQDIITDGNKTNIKIEAIIDGLFGENEDDALTRLSLNSSGIKPEQRQEIKQYKNILIHKNELEQIKNPIEQLRFANRHAATIEHEFNNKLYELVENPNKLTTTQKINFVLQSHEELTSEIPAAKDCLDKLKQNILVGIEIKELLVSKDISQQGLLNIIKNKNPGLLKELFETKVTLEQHKTAGSNDQIDLRQAMPSFANLQDKELITLVNKISIPALSKVLKDIWDEKKKEEKKNDNNTKETLGNNGIPVPVPPPAPSPPSPPPPPPPPSNNNFGANDYLIKMGISPNTIKTMENLPEPKNFSKEPTHKKTYKFTSPVAEEHYNSSSSLIGGGMLLSSLKKLEKAIKEEVLEKYIAADPDRKINHPLLQQAFGEKFDYDGGGSSNVNFDHNFIGPRTETGQEIHQLYEQERLKLAQDRAFSDYVRNNANFKKDEKQLLISFIEQLETECPELEEKYGNLKPVTEAQATTEPVADAETTTATTTEAQTTESIAETTTTTATEAQATESIAETALKAVAMTATEAPTTRSNEAIRRAETESQEVTEISDDTNTSEEDTDEGYESEVQPEYTETVEAITKPELLEENKPAVEASNSKVKEEMAKKAALFNTVTSNHHKPVHMFINSRFNLGAAAAGDEDAIITRGLWISSLYGVSSQGAWKNIPKYHGHTVGLTIGIDTEFSNSSDIIGMAYSRVESNFKYNKKLGKTALNGHLLSVYGLKELPKNFSLQGITSFGYNYIKNKVTNVRNIIGKYKNNNFNFETLLNYKYRTKYNVHLIPNIGLKYDYSRNSDYKESDNIQNLMIQKKSNQSLTGNLGSKIVLNPVRILNNITLTPSLHGNIERHFHNKNTKINAKAAIKNKVIEEKIILAKQPKLGYNIGGNVLLNKKNIDILLEYNYYMHKKYQSYQGLIKLKINL